MSKWDQWVGREQQRSDWLGPQIAKRFCATLDRALCSDGTVPQGSHWCVCLPEEPTAGLGLDGHPIREESDSSFLPPVPLERRMWAGSNVDFIRPLRTAACISRVSRIMSVTEKHGGSGALTFVNIAHDTFANGELAVSEVQTLVYREPVGFNAATSQDSSARVGFNLGNWEMHRSISPTEALLFRYSALTFNSHRIHYDCTYATRVEGYKGLLVHGPLTATMLLQLAAEKLGDNALTSFNFRAISPAICGEILYLGLKCEGIEVKMGAHAADGREVMRATGRV